MAKVKIFISQPMHNLTTEEINDQREYVILLVARALGVEMNDIEVVNPILRVPTDEDYKRMGVEPGGEMPRTWYLGQAIQEMSLADIFIFDQGWDRAHGCRVEWEAYHNYFDHKSCAYYDNIENIWKRIHWQFEEL